MQDRLESPANALPSSVDVAVIGGGPAGSSAAALLRKKGHAVAVFEAQRFPRFVIGESLLAHCMDHLDEAGMLDAVKERAYLVKGGALFLRGAERSDFDFADQFTKGWSWTWQVPRADFDLTLANAAYRQGVPIFYEQKVTALDVGPPHTLTMSGAAGEHRLTARWVIDASGYGRVLPRLLGLDTPSSLPPRKALFSHVTGDRRPSGPDENRIWICMHPGGAWIWIIPFSDGVTSVGVVADLAFFERYAGDDEAVLRAALAEEPNARDRLRDAKLLWAPRILESFSASVTRMSGPGYVLVGNATEFLDPVFSSGVTLALESANRAAKLVDRALAGESPDWARDYEAYMGVGIDAFRTFVEGWYSGEFPRVLFAPNPSPAIRRQITSVLAGYVWDQANPFVREPERKLRQVLNIIAREEAAG
ncbi:MAG: tryptophan 7-halogenase [Deltaproteobacteria bacterium]|nr:tryptophan 7-halogenase [Deltaproteobacteria bacterium]